MKDILHHTSYGAGFPVIVLHGLFGSQRNWSPIAKTLAGNYRAITLDARNHGDSFWADSMSYPEMAEDVAEWMLAAGIAKAHLIGHSMGGKTAMTLALSYPHLVEKLVVIDIAPVDYRGIFSEVLPAMERLPLDRIRTRAEADRLLSPAIVDGNLRMFLTGTLVRQNGTYRWRFNLNGIKNSMATIGQFPNFRSDSFASPTLFLKGEHSDYISPRHFPHMYRFFPNAVIKIVPKSGHIPHFENPVGCRDLLQAFLG